MQFIKNKPGVFRTVKVGDIVEGVVISRDSGKIVVDLGSVGTGAVYRGEIQNAREIVRGLEPGSVVHARVVETDNKDGYIELSLAEADKQKAWNEVKELYESGEIFPVKIKGANRGGLVADVAGISAFMPVSQLSEEHYPDVNSDKERIIRELQKFMGKELSVKVIDINQDAEKVILSEREAVQVNSAELVKQYSVGQVVQVAVSGVADFGAFVKFTDNPAVEGLIHVSELSHRLVENPKEIVSVDDVLQAKIIEITNGKIYLSLKALEEDPWETEAKHLSVGDEIRGRVYQFNPFGAIINLENGLQGQIHITVFGGMAEMKSALKKDELYTFIVQDVRPEEKRIMLKLKTETAN